MCQYSHYICHIRCQGGVVSISKCTLMVMKGLLQKGTYDMQGMTSTTTFKCPAPKVKYLESFMDRGDLFGTNKKEKYKLHTLGKASKFLISNIAFDVPALVKQIEGTC
ncbi:hypothetical protein CDL15_Pgr024605 [Punica granatum]|uniref:Uncharacterized protein n=1 Tax=Punica granatum TaxID=22663 RepID=A0A218XYZ4_PUNGR|nr:hypothetical protein CDL15_Pgr024605 [Punica granatum]